MMLLNYIIMSC